MEYVTHSTLLSNPICNDSNLFLLKANTRISLKITSQSRKVNRLARYFFIVHQRHVELC